MKRFNLLLVNNEAMIGHSVLKTLGKVFKSNFVFEMSTMDEAERLMGKLNIHLMLIDLDHHTVDLKHYSDLYPNTYVMGYHSKQSSIHSVLEPFRNKIIRKEALTEELLVDFKNIRKEWNEGVSFVQRIPNFRELFRMVPG